MGRKSQGGYDAALISKTRWCIQQALDKQNNKMSVEQVIDSLDCDSGLVQLLFDFVIAVRLFIKALKPYWAGRSLDDFRLKEMLRHRAALKRESLDHSAASRDSRPATASQRISSPAVLDLGADGSQQRPRSQNGSRPASRSNLRPTFFLDDAAGPTITFHPATGSADLDLQVSFERSPEESVTPSTSAERQDEAYTSLLEHRSPPFASSAGPPPHPHSPLLPSNSNSNSNIASLLPGPSTGSSWLSGGPSDPHMHSSSTSAAHSLRRTHSTTDLFGPFSDVTWLNPANSSNSTSNVFFPPIEASTSPRQATDSHDLLSRRHHGDLNSSHQWLNEPPTAAEQAEIQRTIDNSPFRLPTESAHQQQQQRSHQTDLSGNDPDDDAWNRLSPADRAVLVQQERWSMTPDELRLITRVNARHAASFDMLEMLARRRYLALHCTRRPENDSRAATQHVEIVQNADDSSLASRHVPVIGAPQSTASHGDRRSNASQPNSLRRSASIRRSGFRVGPTGTPHNLNRRSSTASSSSAGSRLSRRPIDVEGGHIPPEDGPNPPQPEPAALRASQELSMSSPTIDDFQRFSAQRRRQGSTGVRRRGTEMSSDVDLGLLFGDNPRLTGQESAAGESQASPEDPAVAESRLRVLPTPRQRVPAARRRTREEFEQGQLDLAGETGDRQEEEEEQDEPMLTASEFLRSHV